MALTNAEKQARWLEKHIARRRTAQRIVNLLVRQNQTDEHVEEVADLLATFFNRAGIKTLSRILNELHSEALWKEQARRRKGLWLRAHPGRTAKDYDELGEERLLWRQAKGQAAGAAEKQERWQRRRERRMARAK